MPLETTHARDGLDALAELFTLGPAAILTGAGVSTDSGIPDYRGAGTPPRTPMSFAQFTQDDAYRRRFWAGARIGALHMREVEPNAGHFAIAQIEAAGHLSGVITQNVDGLHVRAGTQRIAELHGNGGVIRCVTEDHRFTRAEVLHWFDIANPDFVEANQEAEVAPDGDATVGNTDDVRIPMCPVCGGMLRPDVVYFGEHVPKKVFAKAEQITAEASSLIIAGSSLAVNTGIRLVHRAEARGIPLAVINRGPTTVDQRPSLQVRIDDGTTEIFTALAQRLGA